MEQHSNTVERTMFYGAKPIIFERAKALRQNPTKAEKALWDILKKKQMLNLRFKQQHPINIFIADFYCHAIKLVIEVDGDIHNSKDNKDYDQNRTDELKSYGINVIRFNNKDILEKIDDVKKIIVYECKKYLKV